MIIFRMTGTRTLTRRAVRARLRVRLEEEEQREIWDNETRAVTSCTRLLLSR